MDNQHSGWFKYILGGAVGIGIIIGLGWLFDSPEGMKADSKGSGSKKMKVPPGIPEAEWNKLTHEQQQQVMEYMASQKGPSSPASIETQNAVQKLMQEAESAKQQGNYDLAASCYNKAIKLLSEDAEFGPDHEYVALSRYALALSYKQQQKFNQAIEEMSRAIDSLEKHFDKPEVTEQMADALASLADSYISIGKFNEADKPLQKSIKIVEAKNSFLKGYKSKVKSAQEKSDYEMAVKKTQQELGILYDTLAKLRFQQKRYTDVEEVGKKALSILQAAFGKDEKVVEPLLITSQLRVCEALMLLGKKTDAIEGYNKILGDQAEKYGANSLQVLHYCKLFAKSLVKHSESPEIFLQRAIKIMEGMPTLRKEVQEELLEAQNTLAMVYKEKGKLNESNQLIEKVKANITKFNLSAPSTVSTYLRTGVAAIEFATLEDDKFAPYFSLTLKVEKKLPSGAVLQVTFPNEQTDVAVTDDQKEILVKSSNSQEPITETIYDINVCIYSNSAKTDIIGHHHAMVVGPIDTTEIATASELNKKMTVV